MGDTKMATQSADNTLQAFWKTPLGLGVILIYFMIAATMVIPSMKALQPVDKYYNNIYGSAAGFDFRIFYVAGKLASDSEFSSIYEEQKFDEVWRKTYDITMPGRVHFSYPPLSLMVWAPLSQLPYPVALSLWIGIPFLGVLLLVYYITRNYLVLAATLFSPLFLFSGITGQTGYLITLLLAGGLISLDNKKYILAGILFGLLCFKPHLALALPLCLILTRQWKTIASGTVTFLALIALSYLIFGSESWNAFFHQFGHSLNTEYQKDGESTASSFTLWNIILQLTNSKVAAFAIHALGTIFAIFMTVYTWKYTLELVPRLLTLIIFPAFISPYFHGYDFSPLIVIFAIMVKDLLYKQEPGRATFVTIMIWVLGYGAFKEILHIHFLIPTFFIILLMVLAPVLATDDKDTKEALT